MNYKVETLIAREKIEERIKELAKIIEKEYTGRNLVCVGLLKGSVIFLSDLVKEINLPLLIDFMSVSSYGNEMTSSGNIKILKDVDLNLNGKDVLIIEDIIDTGLTLDFVQKFISAKGARDVKTCTLLSKPERRLIDVKVDYVGFEVPDKFVIGYGLDYNQNHRNLPYIGVVIPE